MSINLLDTVLVNQIAAGEVIERPSSVLKELLENSLDACADQITIEAENGGTSLLKIQDNGTGIEVKDLPLALTQHATSKIAVFEDLARLSTLGFRGEALASIASVSRLTLISRVMQADTAYQIKCEGDPRNYSLTPAVHPQGTTVEIRDLFFNLPVRQKFLKKPATEYTNLNEWLGRLILSRAEVNFTFRHNQKTIWQFMSANNEKAQLYRANKLLDEHFMEKALPVKASTEGYRIYGWVSQPSYYKNQPDFQYFYLNRRWIKDKNLLHAVRLAYRDLLPLRTFPLVLLFLEVNSEFFDVNVHPSKTEVRFNEPRVVHDLVFGAVKQALSQRPTVSLGATLETKMFLKKDPEIERKSLGEFKQEKLFSLEKNHNLNNYSNLDIPSKLNLSGITGDGVNKWLPKEREKLTPFAEKELHVVEKELHDKVNLGRALAYIQQTFILAENEEGLVIVDVHAACERIIYEKLKAELAVQEHLASQRLLLPLSIKVKGLSLTEIHQKLLQRLGFEWRENGEDRFLLLAVPAILKGDSGEIFSQVLMELKQVEISELSSYKVDRFLATIACHGSVRAGQKLTPEEMDDLLRQIENWPNSDRCNHGRPTWVQLDKKTLNKLFLRN